MSKRALSLRVALVLLLTLAVFHATIQAKRGVYYPEQSAHGIISKIIKLKEFRIENIPVETAEVAFILPLVVQFRLQPVPLEEETPKVTLPPLFDPYWFRPPPALA